MTQRRCYEPQSSAERLTKVGRCMAGIRDHEGNTLRFIAAMLLGLTQQHMGSQAAVGVVRLSQPRAVVKIALKVIQIIVLASFLPFVKPINLRAWLISDKRET